MPVLASLRAAWPSATIDWIVQAEFAPAVASHPAVDEVIPFHRERWRSWWRRPGAFVEAIGWLRGLRRRRYDIVIDCQGLSRSALMTLATGAKRRVGHRDARELGWLAYNQRVTHARETHTVDRMLELVEACGIPSIPDMRLYLDEDDRAWWAARRATLGLIEAPYVVLAPTSRWRSKRWPVERWPDLVESLQAVGFSRCLAIGAPGEQEQVAPLAAMDGVTSLVGETSISQTMAVIAEAGLVIANDSAPLHMAVGFDRPCVGLFGPTDPAIVGPYGRLDSVIRSTRSAKDASVHYRDKRPRTDLMQRITTAQILERVHEMLKAGHGPEQTRIGVGVDR